MTHLQTLLTQATQELHDQYIKQTELWAIDEFNRQTEIPKRTVKQWCEEFGIEPQIITKDSGPRYRLYKIGSAIFPDNFYNTKAAATMDRLQRNAERIVRKGLQAFINDSLSKAEFHYKLSIEKLADRIMKKGLKIDSIKITSGRLNLNFEVTLTDGEKTVRAWTIIASGEIQRPHYRYLVK